MADKRVIDVGTEYEESSEPAGNAKIRRIKSAAKRLKFGRLERDVDLVLQSKGLKLDEPVAAPGKRLRR